MPSQPDRGVTDAAYLAAIVESSDDGIIGKDLSGIIRSWNRGAQEIFGYLAEEVIGRPIQILFPPDRVGEEDQIVERIRRGERVDHHETVRRRKDGTDFPVSVTVSPIRDANGAIVGASKILRDITELRETQRALALNEAEFRASFESAAVGKVLADPLTRQVIRANQAFARMVGQRTEDLVGRAFAEFIFSDDLARDATGYSDLLFGASAAQVDEIRLVGPDGALIWVRASVTVAMAPDSGRPFLAVIAIEDIDVRYRAQLELLQTKRDLEQLVLERTKALTERDILLREVYHRVKNNLQVVDGLLMLQAQKIEDPRARTSLMGLRPRIFALGLVHQQLMGSSDLKTFDVAPFLRELSQNIIGGGASTGIKLTVNACPLDVGLDFAIPLGLLVTEIVTNSLKHAFPEGIGEISVVLRPDDRARVALVISDNGQGGRRPAEASTHIGLGSRLVSSLVRQLEGEMVVREDAGTTTEIFLPLPEPS